MDSGEMPAPGITISLPAEAAVNGAAVLSVNVVELAEQAPVVEFTSSATAEDWYKPAFEASVDMPTPESEICPPVPLAVITSPLVVELGPVVIAAPLPASGLLLVTVEDVAATGICPAVMPEIAEVVAALPPILQLVQVPARFVITPEAGVPSALPWYTSVCDAGIEVPLTLVLLERVAGR